MTAATFVTLLMAAVEAFPMMMTTLMVFSVIMAALMSPAMMTMVVAFGIRIIFKRSFSKRFRRSIR